MPKTYFGFDDGEAPKPKDVSETKQLEPRMGAEPYATGENKLERYSKDHGPLGALGDRTLKTKS